MSSVSSLTLTLPDLRVQALEAGPKDGPLVLLLHGFPELSESWREVLPRLAEAGLHAVAPDLRGYGSTERPARGYDLDTLAEDVAHMVRILQPGGPAHVVGHDWGGLIAYHLAATRPEAVDRLAVINCPHPAVFARRLWRPAQLARSWYIFFFQLPYLPERLLSARHGALVPRLIRRSLVHPQRVSEQKLASYAASFSRPEAARAAIRYYRELFRRSWTPRGLRRWRHYPLISAPFLLIWGEQDMALLRELSEGLEPYFERQPVVRYLSEVGHFVPLEAPEEVAVLLLEHLGVGRAPSSRDVAPGPGVESTIPGALRPSPPPPA